MKYRNNTELLNHVDSIGSVKILFVLRPKSLILWDIPMRRHFSNGGNGYACIKYIKMLNEVINDLVIQCKNNNFTIEEVPKK